MADGARKDYTDDSADVDGVEAVACVEHRSAVPQVCGGLSQQSSLQLAERVQEVARFCLWVVSVVCVGGSVCECVRASSPFCHSGKNNVVYYVLSLYCNNTGIVTTPCTPQATTGCKHWRF
jgi:hypothetical protein